MAGSGFPEKPPGHTAGCLLAQSSQLSPSSCRVTAAPAHLPVPSPGPQSSGQVLKGSWGQGQGAESRVEGKASEQLWGWVPQAGQSKPVATL